MTTVIDLPLLNIRIRQNPADRRNIHLHTHLLKQRLVILVATIMLGACSGERPDFSNTREDNRSLRQSVVATALNMKGKPYRYGGNDPSGFDCSGLVQYSYKKSGLMLPRTTYKQYRTSKAVYLSRIQPGDLVFYRITNSLVSHVGIYIGNNQFIHAPSTGKTVSIENINDPFWQKRFVGAGGILQ